MGDTLTYTITITIPRGAVTYDATFTDTIPDGLTVEQGSCSIAVSDNFFGTSSPTLSFNGTDPTVVSSSDIGDVGSSWNSGDPLATINVTIVTKIDNFFSFAGVSGDNNVNGLVDKGDTFANSATYAYNKINNKVPLDPRDKSNESNSTTTTIIEPTLSINKTASESIVEASELVRFEVQICNNGTGIAYHPVLEDTLPAEMRGADPLGFTGANAPQVILNSETLSASNYSASFNATTGLLQFSLDHSSYNDLQASYCLTIRYTAQVDATIGAPRVGTRALKNAAILTNAYSLPDGINDTGRKDFGPLGPTFVELTTAEPLATKSSTVNGDPADTVVGKNDTVVYTIKFPEPTIGTTLYDLNFSDTIPDGFDLVNVTFSGGVGGSMNFTAPARKITGTFDRTDPASQIEITITAKVDSNLRFDNGTNIPPGRQFENFGLFTWYDAPDTDTARIQRGTRTNTVVLSLPGISLEPNNTGVASPGTTVTYLHFVRNTGSETDNITITYPASSLNWAWQWYVTDYQGNITSGPYTSGETINNVAAGGTVYLKFTAFVPQNTPSGAMDTLVITATSASNSQLTDTATDLTTVSDQAPTLKLFKTVDKVSAKPGEELLYTVTYINIGTTTLNDIRITDPVSPYSTFVYNSFGAGNDIEWIQPGPVTVYLTSVADGDEGEFNGEYVIIDFGSLSLLSGQKGSVSYKVVIK